MSQMSAGLDVRRRTGVGEAERVLSADGTSIAYRRLGRGPRVLAVHGGLGTWRSWLAVARRLADRYELVLVERRGRGDSPDGGASYALAREVEDLAAVCDRVGSVRAVVGHSFGATVALELAREAQIGSLVVYEPAAGAGGRIPGAVLARIETLLARGDAEGALAVTTTHLDVAGLVRAGRRSPDAPWPRGLVELAPTLARELRAVDVLGPEVHRYAQISSPALVLAGAASPAPARQLCARLADILPEGRLATLAGHGHMAHLQVPDDTAAAIAAFIDGLSVERHAYRRSHSAAA